MSQPVTEIATITLLPEIDIKVGDAAQIWQATLTKISEQPGFKGCHYGLHVENKNMLTLLVDWDDISSHEAFMKSPGYAPFLENVNKINSNIHLQHAIIKPGSTSLLSDAPMIEFATFYSIEDGFLENMNKFNDILLAAAKKKEIEGFHGITVAEVLEEIAQGGSQHGRGKAVHLLIGWNSVQAHMDFRDTALFQDSVGLLRDKKGAVGMFHADFRSS